MKSISIRSFNGIGDALFMTPSLRVIKKAYPKSRVIVNTNHPDLFIGNPFLDGVGRVNEGVFLGYADPIHRVNPTKHHILADWEIICEAYGLETEKPDLKPEIYLPLGVHAGKRVKIGVQSLHKGHWHEKKVWPKFDELAKLDGFEAIPKVGSVIELVRTIATYPAVVCAEGGISHIAKAVDVPAVVIYGGFANPEWNGYRDQINLCNVKECSYCYHPGPCVQLVERLCMKEITLAEVLRAVKGLRKLTDMAGHNQMRFVMEDAKLWCRGSGLDIGAGKAGLPWARPVDLGEENAYWIDEKTGSQDFVFSSHCLEHLESPGKALAEWIRVLKPGGILYLYLPHPDYVPWRKESMPKWHKHNFYTEDVAELCNFFKLDILEMRPKDYWFGHVCIARKPCV